MKTMPFNGTRLSVNYPKASFRCGPLTARIPGGSACSNFLSGCFSFALSFSVASVLALVLSWSISPVAQANTKGAFALSQQLYNQLEKVQAMIAEGQHANATGELNSLRSKNTLSGYEKAQVWNLTAYNFYLQNDFAAAVNAYNQVLQQPEIPAGLAISTYKTLAQLHYSLNQFDDAISRLDQLAKQVRPDAGLLFLKAHCHYQLEQYPAAIRITQQLVTSHHHSPQAIPQENWLTLLQASYHQLHDYPGMVQALELLVSYYPRRQHLLTLASVYSQTEASLKQLALLESLWDNRQLTEAVHISNLVALHLQAGAPYKAAVVLDSAMAEGHMESSVENRKRLAQTWLLAKEETRAINTLESALKSPGNSEEYIPLSELCLMLGQLYFARQEWQNSLGLLQQCPGNDSSGIARTNLMAGIAHLNLHQFDQARARLQRAADHPEFNIQASQWLAYRERELTRKQQLARLAASAER